jgi:hypothetical protein
MHTRNFKTPKIKNMRRQKTNELRDALNKEKCLSKYKKIEIIPFILSELELSKKNSSRKYTATRSSIIQCPTISGSSMK